MIRSVSGQPEGRQYPSTPAMRNQIVDNTKLDTATCGGGTLAYLLDTYVAPRIRIDFTCCAARLFIHNL